MSGPGRAAAAVVAAGLVILLGTGSGRSSNASTRLKTGTFAPMPAASERTATIVNVGDRRRARRARRRSRMGTDWLRVEFGAATPYR